MKVDSEVVALMKATKRVSRAPRDLVRRAQKKILKKQAMLRLEGRIETGVAA